MIPLFSKCLRQSIVPVPCSSRGRRRKTTYSRPRSSRWRSSRRATVLVAALVCLLVVMTMLGAMLEGTLRARRQLHTERDRRQTELLLEAGSRRAAYRIAHDSDYRGETWELSAAVLHARAGARVTITPTRDSPDQPWQVRVVAEYPQGSERSIRRSRKFHIQSQSTDI